MSKHKMGKECGYDEYKDGSIKIAPTYDDEFKRLLNDQNTNAELMRLATLTVRQYIQRNQEAMVELWNRVSEDYRFDNKKYIYSYEAGFITKSLKEKKKEDK